MGQPKKGIGPAYTDKISRVGIRMADLIDPEVFAKLLKEYLPFKNAQLTKLYGEEALNYDDIFNTYVEYGRQLAPYVTDTSYLLGQLMGDKKRVVSKVLKVLCWMLIMEPILTLPAQIQLLVVS